MVVFEDRVKVSLYEIPELALSIQNTKGLCEPTKWLPGEDSNLEPSGYSYPEVSFRTGLSLHRSPV